MVRSSLLALLVCLLIATTIGAQPPAQTNRNLLANGDFAIGAGNSPDHWQTQGWIQSPETTTYTWHPPKNGSAALLEVASTKANDARWMQSLQLSPGWYYASADIRAENIPADNGGASICILEDGVSSIELRGTTNYTRVGFYVRIGPKGADVELALRLGGFGGLNTGKAFFRDASLIKVDAPPPQASPTYDLEQIRKAGIPSPIGQPWTLAVVFIVLGALAVWGWREFGAAQAEQAPEVRQARPPGDQRPKEHRPRKASRR